MGVYSGMARSYQKGISYKKSQKSQKGPFADLESFALLCA